MYRLFHVGKKQSASVNVSHTEKRGDGKLYWYGEGAVIDNKTGSMKNLNYKYSDLESVLESFFDEIGETSTGKRLWIAREKTFESE